MTQKTRVEINGEYDENFCLIEGDRAEVWGQNYSSHAYKDRDYPAHLVRVTTRNEAMSLASEKFAAERQAKVEREAAEAKKQTRQEWINTLAGKTFHGCTVSSRGEVEDSYGNYLFSLPQNKPADVGKWIKTELDAWLEGGE